MRSVKVTVEILGTGLTQTLHGEIDTSSLDSAIRAKAEVQTEAAARIVDKALSVKVCEIGMRACESLVDRLVPWIRDVEQKGEDRPTRSGDEGRRMIQLVRERVMLRMTNLGEHDLEIIRSLVEEGKLQVLTDRGEQYATRA